MKMSETKLSAISALALSVVGFFFYFVLGKGSPRSIVGLFLSFVLALAILNCLHALADNS